MINYGQIAHEAYEVAASLTGWETNPASRVPWNDVPLENRVATTMAANTVANAEREAIISVLRANMFAMQRAEIETADDECNAACAEWLKTLIEGFEAGAHLAPEN